LFKTFSLMIFFMVYVMLFCCTQILSIKRLIRAIPCFVHNFFVPSIFI
jgi:hypothetical protein